MEVEDHWALAEKCVSEDLSDHNKALKHLKDAVKLAQTNNDDEALVLSLVRLGDRHRARQQWEEARAAYEEAAPKFTQFFDEVSEEHVELLHWIATCFLHRRLFERAKEFGLRSLKIIEKLGLNDSYTQGRALILLGQVAIDDREYRIAITQFQMARPMVEEENLHDLAALLNSESIAYGYLTEDEKALEIREEEIELVRVLYGADSVRMATSLHSAGGLCSALKDYKKALEFEEKAVELRERLLGPRHHDTKFAKTCLAAVKRALAEEKKQGPLLGAKAPAKQIESGAADGKFCRVCLKSGSVFSCTGCKSALYCSQDCQSKDWPEHKKSCKSGGAVAVVDACQVCNKIVDKLLTCSVCKSRFFCSAECQRADWKTHKTECKKAN